MNENLNEESLSEENRAKIKKIKEEDAQKKVWLEELEANPTVQAYFKKYTQDSVMRFIDRFLWKKSLWANYAPRYLKEMQEEGREWVESASEHLEYIQQKRLFDLQCLWRAEKIKLDGIELCVDFAILKSDILNCQNIDPISKEDIDIYVNFLLSDEAAIESSELEGWEDYEELKEAYHDENSNHIFPAWYDYHYTMTGNSYLLDLPDIRGEKEEFYANIVRQKNAEKNEQEHIEFEKRLAKKQETEINDYNEEHMDWFVKTFESKENYQLYKAMIWKDEERGKRDFIEYDFDLLFSANEDVPIEYNSDWREGVRIAANKYRNRKIAEAMPTAWELYNINLQNGISFHADESDIEMYKFVKKQTIETLIEGRILNGEPDNLDF